MIEIKPVGNHLEAVCSGCGEVLLIGSGDSVNFRLGAAMEVGGVNLPMPEAILCSVCSRNEGDGTEATMKFLPMVCSHCGADLSDCESPPNFELDDNGECSGVLCSDCSEPWRRGE
jgi:hypothetical protein